MVAKLMKEEWDFKSSNTVKVVYPFTMNLYKRRGHSHL